MITSESPWKVGATCHTDYGVYRIANIDDDSELTRVRLEPCLPTAFWLCWGRRKYSPWPGAWRDYLGQWWLGFSDEGEARTVAREAHRVPWLLMLPDGRVKTADLGMRAIREHNWSITARKERKRS